MKLINQNQIQFLNAYLDKCNYGGRNKDTTALYNMINKLPDAPEKKEKKKSK